MMLLLWAWYCLGELGDPFLELTLVLPIRDFTLLLNSSTLTSWADTIIMPGRVGSKWQVQKGHGVRQNSSPMFSSEQLNLIWTLQAPENVHNQRNAEKYKICMLFVMTFSRKVHKN